MQLQSGLSLNMGVTLYHFPPSGPSRGALLSAKAAGVEVDIQTINLFAKEQLNESFVKVGFGKQILRLEIFLTSERTFLSVDLLTNIKIIFIFRIKRGNYQTKITLKLVSFSTNNCRSTPNTLFLL